MVEPVDDAIRTVSKMLCGSLLRLPVAIWIRSQPEGTVFYQRKIALALQTDARYLSREFHILDQLGMITPQPSSNKSDVRRYYQADHTHPLWTIIDTAAAACARTAQIGAFVSMRFHPTGGGNEDDEDCHAGNPG